MPHIDFGDILIKRGLREVAVWTGSEWESITGCLNDVTPFMGLVSVDESLHDEYSALKNLWEEYHIMKKLLTGQ